MSGLWCFFFLCLFFMFVSERGIQHSSPSANSTRILNTNAKGSKMVEGASYRTHRIGRREVIPKASKSINSATSSKLAKNAHQRCAQYLKRGKRKKESTRSQFGVCARVSTPLRIEKIEICQPSLTIPETRFTRFEFLNLHTQKPRPVYHNDGAASERA